MSIIQVLFQELVKQSIIYIYGTRISFSKQGDNSEYLIILQDKIAKLGYCRCKQPKFKLTRY